MGRRKKQQADLFEEVFAICMHLSWPGVFVFAGIVYGVVRWGLPLIGASFGPGPGGAPHPLAMLLQGLSGTAWLLALVVLLVGGVAQVKRLQQRRLLDKQENIESIRALSWRSFETLLAEAYRRLGYHAEPTAAGADGGVDLVIHRKGKRYLVQAKQWRTQKVGVKVVRELFGVVTAEKADGGVLVTSGSLTRDADDFCQANGLEIVDADRLVEMIQTLQAGGDDTGRSGAQAQAPAAEPIDDNDSPACPECGKPMVRRTARKGANAGSAFWGCSSFPRCRGTRAVGGGLNEEQ